MKEGFNALLVGQILLNWAYIIYALHEDGVNVRFSVISYHIERRDT